MYQLASDGHPRFIGMDKGGPRGDVTTVCEVEMLPDGTILVVDIQQHVEPAISEGKDT